MTTQTNKIFFKGMAAKAQRGYSIMELLIVFLVVGVLMAALRYGYNLVYGSKAQADVKYMEYAMDCARSTFDNYSSYSTATIGTLANNNCFPPNLVTGKGSSTAYVSNKYGGLITVSPTNVVGISDGLEFTEPNIPSDVCIERLKLSTKPVKVTVTAQGGSEVVVMAVGATAPDLTLSTACGVGTTATIKSTITKN